jgi:hypothetical protein
MSEVLILGEVKGGSLDTRTLELLGAGKNLPVKWAVNFPSFSWEMSFDVADEALKFGPARVYKMEHPLLAGFKPDLWVAALEQACREINPKVLLMSHSFVGMEVGPRLSARLNSRLTTDCIDLAMDPEDGCCCGPSRFPAAMPSPFLNLKGNPNWQPCVERSFPLRRRLKPQERNPAITLKSMRSMIPGGIS